jgi:hypothetical protein
MKAERRHELKSNSLVQSLKLFPEAVKQYQSQIALVVVLIALAIVLLRYRLSAAEQRLNEAQESLSIASDDLQRLQSTAPVPGADMQMVMKEREDFFSEGLQRADEAFQKAPDSKAALKAQALILKGDFNFNMANLPDLPGAATQPSLRPSEGEENLLSKASDAYTQVLQNYASEKFAVAAAHFGLAAVAENKGAWDAAKAQYQAISDGNAETPYKNLASARLALIPELALPVAVDLPATQPAAATRASGVTTTPSQAIGPAKR